MIRTRKSLAWGLGQSIHSINVSLTNIVLVVHAFDIKKNRSEANSPSYNL